MPKNYRSYDGPDQEPDEDKDDASAAMQNTAPKPDARANEGATGDYMRTFQPTIAGARDVPGQQTRMPWGGQVPGLAMQGQSVTPWSQGVQGPPQGAQPPMGQPRPMPNWVAIHK